MMKKLAIAVIFAGSTLVTAPAVNASSGYCQAKFQDDLVECDGDINCENWAEVMFLECIRGEWDTIDPEPNT